MRLSPSLRAWELFVSDYFLRQTASVLPNLQHLSSYSAFRITRGALYGKRAAAASGGVVSKNLKKSQQQGTPKRNRQPKKRSPFAQIPCLKRAKVPISWTADMLPAAACCLCVGCVHAVATVKQSFAASHLRLASTVPYSHPCRTRGSPPHSPPPRSVDVKIIK